VLTFFGFMHGERIGIAQTPVVAVSYLAVSAIFLSCAKFTVPALRPLEEAPEPDGVHAAA
jgi:AGZA family xanthine/uracil permease-like MFS transporter